MIADCSCATMFANNFGDEAQGIFWVECANMSNFDFFV
jgi:hypothetical protein